MAGRKFKVSRPTTGKTSKKVPKIGRSPKTSTPTIGKKSKLKRKSKFRIAK